MNSVKARKHSQLNIYVERTKRGTFMGIENKANIIPSWMDPALAIATFGSSRDIDYYNHAMRGDIPLFDPAADSAYNRVPDPSIITGNGGSTINSSTSGLNYNGGMLINNSRPGTGYNGGYQISTSTAGTLSGKLTGDDGFFISNSNPGIYVPSNNPTDKKGNDDGDDNKNKRVSYTYSNYSFTLDSSGKPTFKGPVDDDHSDGKWKLEEINSKLSENDYNRLKRAVDDARKTEGFSPLYETS